MGLAVVLPALGGGLDDDGHGVLGDGQRAGRLRKGVIPNSIAFAVVVLNYRVSSEFTIGVDACIRSAGRRVVKHGHGITFEKAFNRHVIGQARAITLLLAARINNCRFTLSRLVSNRNRQRKRVVNDDDVVVRVCINRNLLARIIRIECAILIGRIELSRGCCCVLGTNRLRCAFLNGNSNLRAQQVVVHGDVCLVQLEVSVVGVLLILTAGVLVRREVGVFANMLGAVVNGPVVKDVSRRRSSCGRTYSGTGLNQNGFARGVNRSHAGAVGSHSVVNGDFALFPHGEEVFVGLFLISCNLGGSVTVNIRVTRTGPHKEVGSGATLGLGPTLEGVARARLSADDIHGLIDLDTGIGVVQRTLAIVLGTVVAVPIDVRRSLDFFVPVHGLQLDDVVIVVIRVIDHIFRSDNGSGVFNGNPCVALHGLKRLTGGKRGSGINKR